MHRCFAPSGFWQARWRRLETLYPVALRVCLRITKFENNVAILMEAEAMPLRLQANARALRRIELCIGHYQLLIFPDA